MPVKIETTENGVRIGSVELIWALHTQEFLFSNSIVVHGENPIAIDPSANFSYLSDMARARYIKMVFNTHFHGDHRSLNHLFKEVEFACHELDADAICDLDVYAQKSASDHEAIYLNWIYEFYKKYKITDSPVTRRSNDGDILDSGGERVRVIHIPGHTPGHCALHFENANILFTSDVDLTPYGPWYASPVSDIDQFIVSIGKLEKIECDYYVPSHGERIYDRGQFLKKLAVFKNHFKERDEKIVDALKQGVSEVGEIASLPIVYRRGSLKDPLKCYFQFEMVKKHLERLQNQGIVDSNESRWFLK